MIFLSMMIEFEAKQAQQSLNKYTQQRLFVFLHIKKIDLLIAFKVFL